MSAYIRFATPMLDQECLIAALADMGFGQDRVEVHGAPVPLIGHEGDVREQRAEIVIRRKYVGVASNDRCLLVLILHDTYRLVGPRQTNKFIRLPR
jgi:hypothetical protein